MLRLAGAEQLVTVGGCATPCAARRALCGSWGARTHSCPSIWGALVQLLDAGAARYLTAFLAYAAADAQAGLLAPGQLRPCQELPLVQDGRGSVEELLPALALVGRCFAMGSCSDSSAGCSSLRCLSSCGRRATSLLAMCALDAHSKNPSDVTFKRAAAWGLHEASRILSALPVGAAAAACSNPRCAEWQQQQQQQARRAACGACGRGGFCCDGCSKSSCPCGGGARA
jgi:hypothetical protein